MQEADSDYEAKPKPKSKAKKVKAKKATKATEAAVKLEGEVGDATEDGIVVEDKPKKRSRVKVDPDAFRKLHLQIAR